MRMEGRGDGQETVGNTELSLGVGDSSLVQAVGSLSLAQCKVETVQRLRRTSDNHVASTVNKRNDNVLLLRKMLVSVSNKSFELLSREISDGKHGRGLALAFSNTVLKHRGGKSGVRVLLLDVETNVEEQGHGLDGSLLEGFPRIR